MEANPEIVLASPSRIAINALLILLMASLAAVTFAMSAMTYQLDDIKALIFEITGPFLMALALGIIISRRTPVARSIWISFWAYLAATLVSFVFSAYHWPGGHALLRVWSAAGFFVASICVGSDERAARRFANFLILKLLLFNVLGLLMFNVVSGAGHSFVRYVSDYVNFDTTHRGDFHALLYTLANADGWMQSSALNSSYYAAICLLYLPFAVAVLALRRHWVIRKSTRVVAYCAVSTTIIGFAAAHSALCNIILVALILGAIHLGFLQYKGEFASASKSRIIWQSMFVVLCFSALAYLGKDSIFKGIKSNFNETHAIVERAGWGIFREFPVTGSGPGTLSIYFPRHRPSDYFNHGLSNVIHTIFNFLVMALAETGIVGFITLLALLITLFLSASRALASRGVDLQRRTLLFAALAGLMSFCFSAMFIPVAGWPIGMASMWTMMGFLGGLIVPLHKSTEPSQSQQRVSWNHAMHWASIAVLPLCAIGSTRVFAGLRHQRDALNAMDSTYAQIDKRIIDTAAIEQSLLGSKHEFDQALAINPYDISAAYKLGSVDVTLSRNAMVQANSAALKEHPEAATVQRIKSYEYLDEAKAAYEKVLAMSPDYAELHFNLVIIYQDCAQRAASALIRSDNGESSASEVKRYKELAVEHAERMAELSCRSEIGEQTIGLLLENQHADGALRMAHAFSDLYPDDMDLAKLYLRAANESHDESAALLASARVAKIAPPKN